MERAMLSIGGMSCGHCVRAVAGALEQVDGVRVQSVAPGTAAVLYDPERAPAERLEAAVREAGYVVRELRTVP